MDIKLDAVKIFGQGWLGGVAYHNMIKSDSNNAFEIAKHLKVISLSSKTAPRKLWLFKHSPYEIHIIDINAAYPHHKIAS